MRVDSQQLGDVLLVLVVDVGDGDFRAAPDAAADGGAVQAHLRRQFDIDDAAGHARAHPRAGIAQHHGAARGHVLKRKALDVGARPQAAQRVVERLA